MATVAAQPARVPKRLTVVLLCFLATALCYVDRVNISVAVIPMAARFHWSATTRGAVLSSFFIGYLVAMIPSGALVVRFGSRVVLGLALAAWSVCTLLTPAAAFAGLPLLIAVRVAMGMAEAATFPAAMGLLARWLPAGERSRGIAFNHSGIPVGTVVGLSAASAVVVAYGWAAMFVLFGVAGIGVAALWFAAVRDSPAQHPSIGADERALLAVLSGEITPGPVPWRALLAQRACWAIAINHVASNWTLYLMLTWMPSYLHDVQHLDVGKAGLAAVLPWGCAFLVQNGAGHLCDRLVARGVPLLTVRRVIQVAALLGSAVGLLLAARATTPAGAIAMLCLALGAYGLNASGFVSNFLDVAPRHAAPLYALSNTIATVPGIVGVYLTGWLLDLTGGYGWTFALAAAVNIVAALVWLRWARADCVVD